MRFAALVASLCLLVLASAAQVEARCASVGMTFERIGSGDVSAAAPALLLGLVIRPGTRDVEPVPAAVHLALDGARHALALETIAPGLLRARSTTARAAGTYSVEGVTGSVVVRVAPTASASPPAAPQVVAVTVTRGRRGGATARADLGAPVPAGVAAVIVSSGGVPIAWSALAPSTATNIVVATDGRCVMEPPGYLLPSAGASVTLQFVDASGALSPPSSLVTVR